MNNDPLTKTLVSNSIVIGDIPNFEVDTNTVEISYGNSKAGRIEQLLVYSSTGIPVTDSVRKELDNTIGSLDLFKLPNGIYYIEVMTTAGNYTEKITLLK